MHVCVNVCGLLSVTCAAAKPLLLYSHRGQAGLSTCERVITSWVLRRLTGGLCGYSCQAPLGDTSSDSSISAL